MNEKSCDKEPWDKNKKLVYGLLTTLGISMLWSQGTSIGRNIRICQDYLPCEVSVFAWVGTFILFLFTLFFFIKFIKEVVE